MNWYYPDERPEEGRKIEIFFRSKYPEIGVFIDGVLKPDELDWNDVLRWRYLKSEENKKP
jgi:hypothetical protein